MGGSKRIPSPIKFNVNNENRFNFVKYYSFLLARDINIEIKDDEKFIRNEEEMNEITSIKKFLNKIEKKKIIPQKF